MILGHSPSADRNKAPILQSLRPYLEQLDTVLEIGSASGQHAIHFTQSLSHLHWQCSDQEVYLPDLKKNLLNYRCTGLSQPIELDVNSLKWLDHSLTDKEITSFDAIYTANTLHIMDHSTVENFFAGLSKRIKPNGKLFVYGPFKYQGQFTSDSNAAFDQRLREKKLGCCIKDLEWIEKLAQQAQLKLSDDISMPANNQLLIFNRARQ